MQLNRESITAQDSGLQRMYDFLKLEGLTLEESEKVLSKLDEIHNNIITLNRSYSISEISLIIIELLNDDFFDDNFIICLLEEQFQAGIQYDSLYSLIHSQSLACVC